MEDSLRRKVWNRVEWPVWSLSTLDEEGVANMNICTYVVPVSLKPKAFLVALYAGTKTLENVQKSKSGYLQLLEAGQYPLVRRLGMTSGHDGPKIEYLIQRDMTMKVGGYEILRECLGYVELSFTALYEGGDHVLCYAEVCASKNLRKGEVLTTHVLKERGVIR